MERLKEIDIIRTFVIILLVLYHALCALFAVVGICLPMPNPMKDFTGEENWHTVECWRLLS